MSNLAVKTWVLLLRQGVRLYITEEQADAVKKAKAANRPVHLISEGGIAEIEPSEVRVVLPACALEKSDRMQQGEWQCKHGSWHNKYERCSCREVSISDKYQRSECCNALIIGEGVCAKCNSSLVAIRSN